MSSNFTNFSAKEKISYLLQFFEKFVIFSLCLLFSVEKERANWVLEEDHLRRKLTEMEEFVQRLEQSKENLKKENERLRHDMKMGASQGGPARKQFMFNKP